MVHMSKIIGLFLAAGLIAAFASGCCCHIPCASSRLPSTPVPRQVAAEFDVPRQSETVLGESVTESNGTYRVQRVELAPALNGSATNRALTFDCFVPLRVTKPPVVMILPMLGGSYPLEKFFARYFAKHGLASVIVHREEIDTIPISPADLNDLFRQTVLDNKRAINWLEDRPEFDATRLGVFGVSMGAIKGALLAPLEPRVDAAVLALAAGDLPYILTYTTEPGISRRRAEVMASQNLTEATLQEKLRAGMTCDPMRFAEYADPKKMLLVLATCDSTVPINKGMELRRAMHKPETIFVAAGHYTAVIYVPYLRWQTVRFFKRQFAAQGRR
jgi:dienelactone hydrolase